MSRSIRSPHFPLYCSVLALVVAAACSSDEHDDAPAGGTSGSSHRAGAAASAGAHPRGGEGGEDSAAAPGGQAGAGTVEVPAGGAGGQVTGGADAGGAAGASGSPLKPIGNIEADYLPSHGSVAFVLVGDEYVLFKKEGAEDTSISFIAPDNLHAYGWYRSKPITDPTNVDVAFSLNLQTGEFTDLSFEDSRASIVRGGHGHTLVGKMILMNHTPDTTADDQRLGFVYDLETEELQLVGRDGHSDTGFTAINGAGVITGFNDFGEVGFVYSEGEFRDLTHPDAYRLFPFAITDDSTIVGAWGRTAEDWFDETKGLGFVAKPAAGGGFLTEEYVVPGFAAIYLTGLNDHGAFCGLGHQTTGSSRVLLRGARLGGNAEVVPFPHDYEPFPTGINEAGWVFGQAMAVEAEKECAGHGVLVGAACECDDAYEVDPYDAAICIAVGAACSGHGHEHEAGNCHCDAGFKNPVGEKSKCVPS